MAETATQLAVFLRNVPGALHEMLRSLAEAEINIEGIMVSDAADHAVVRLVVNAPSRAIHLLGERGAVVVESEIVAHDMANNAGELLALSGKLARHKINIAYIYGSTPREGGSPRIFIHSSDDRQVLALLGRSGGPAKAAAPALRPGRAAGPRRRSRGR